MDKQYTRAQFHLLCERLEQPRRFIQVLAGPRQTGKTTIAHQVAEAITIPVHYATADEPTLRSSTWIEQQWEAGKASLRGGNHRGGVLILDEIQKIPGWSETVKRLWDRDTRSNVPLKVVLLLSSPLLVQRGLTESLAGRFEIIHVTHWPYIEMRDAFGWSLEQYVYHGGYPGSAALIQDHERWRNYINDSLIETTISRDILLMNRIDKPALLRQLFPAWMFLLWTNRLISEVGWTASGRWEHHDAGTLSETSLRRWYADRSRKILWTESETA